MKHFALFTFLAVAVSAQEKQMEDRPSETAVNKPAETKPSPRPADTAAKGAEKVEVPQGAIRISEGLFRHTDATGKTYLYQKSPFGVVKTEENARKAASGRVEQPAPETQQPKGNPFRGGDSASTPELAGVKVEDKGDTLHFERRTPFGVTRWTRKKGELNAEENAMVERSRTGRAENTGSK